MKHLSFRAAALSAALSTALSAALSAALLAGCGGSDDGLPEAGNTVPASATASPEAYTEYVGSRTPDDAAEPLTLVDVMPPATDIGEAVPLR